MAKSNPEQHEYLAIVSEWSSVTQYGVQVGNAYPLINITTGKVVEEPLEEFSNPGAVFLKNRVGLKTWDFIVFQPQDNPFYRNSDRRQCYFVPARQPEPLTHPSQSEQVAVVLDHPAFDPSSSTHQILHPRYHVTPIFFVQKGLAIYGPMIRESATLSPLDDVQRIDWRPANEDGVIYEFTADELAQKGVRLSRYSHPEPELNRILATPIHLAYGPVRRVTSGRPRDALTAAGLVEWYAARVPAGDAGQSLAGMKASFRGRNEDHPAIQAARLLKIEREIHSNAAFAEYRERFAKQFLESDAGRQRVAELIEQTVAKRGLELQAEVDRQQGHLAAKRDELSTQLEEAEREHRRRLAALDADAGEARQRVAALEAEAGRLGELLAGDARVLAERVREHVPLLAVLAGVRPDGTASAAPVGVPSLSSARTPAPEYRPIEPSTPVRPIESETRLVDELHARLAGRGLHFARDFIANAYVCLKAEPLNLVIGPPGYGKSMLVAALARALGHADALLRIAVRRSWSEDRHLLGFYDSFHGRYDPGPTGLVPRLLQAEVDWNRDRVGVYVVLLDEFNLAAPEYYFSQLLQTLPADDQVREVRLYDPASVDGGGVPGRVTLTPNLRFWGTINYDETTERLSPRTLDRTGMVFLGEGDVTPTVETVTPPATGVAAGDLFAKHTRRPEDCPEEHWERVSPVIDCLRLPDPALGARVELSPRVRRAIRRYLANSVGVLDPRAAADFVVQQRILPVVRGRGEGFVARIERLRQLLSDANLQRSAAHVEGVLGRSEQHFGELDFLSY